MWMSESSIDVSRPPTSGGRENRRGVVRVNSMSLDYPLTILADQGIEIVAIGKKVMVGRVTRSAYWLNHDPSGMVEAGYGPTTK
jgi:hypothetical protein